MLLKTQDFYEFGDFRIDLAERVLLRNDKIIPVTPKVFETLLVLVENAGRTIEKEELMREIWQDRFVEESNLSFNIGMLRKALGDDASNPIYVETVPRRGYRFIAEVRRANANLEFETADLKSGNGAIAANNGYATNGQQIKSHGANSIDGNYHVKDDAALTNSPAKVSGSKLSRTLLYAALIAIIIGGAAYFLTRRQPNFYERFGSVNSNSGLLSVEKISDTGGLVGMNISPDGKLLVYNAQENGRNTIWLRQIGSGNNISLLTTNDEGIVSTSFSGSGEYIYYTHQRKGEPLNLSRISTFGGTPTLLINNLHSGFSFSPDEKQIAFGRYDEQGSHLLISSADGSSERQVLLSPKPRYLFGINWAPDGKSIAYGISNGRFGTSGTNYGIYELNLEDGSEKSLSDDKWINLENTMWLPDKSGLLVTGRQKLESDDQIWRVSYGDGQAAPLTDNSSKLSIRSASADFTRILASQTTLTSNVWVAPANNLSNARSIGSAVSDVTWTPDGKIIFPTRDSVKTDIWLINGDGAGKRQLTAGDALERSPETSPDGRFIVYVSTENGRQNVWRMNADGGSQTALTNGEGESFPVFTPDGKWVVYSSMRDRSLWRVSVEGGESQQLSSNSHRRISISPDGKKLAHIGRVNNQAKLIIESFPECVALNQFDVNIINEAAFFRTVWARDGKSVIYYINDAAFVGNLWRQSLDGGAPQKLTNFTSERILDFAVSPDENQIAFVRGDWNFDAVLLKGLK